ncbi:MAG: beta-propeller fold lactonase family protein [Terriglobales bacterium]
MWRYACALIIVTVLACSSARAQSLCATSASPKTVAIHLPGHPFEPVFSPNGCTVFVSLGALGQIAVLDWRGKTYRLRRMVRVGGEPTGMVLSRDGATLFAADPRNGDVIEINTRALASGQGTPVRARLAPGQLRGAIYVNVTPNGRDLLVSDESALSVAVLDLRTQRLLGFIPTGRAPIALTFSNNGRWLFLTSEIAARAWHWPLTCKPERDAGRAGPRTLAAGAIQVADMRLVATNPARAVVSTVPAGCSPVRLVLSPDGATAYVTARTDDAVLAFSTAKLIAKDPHPELGSVRTGIAPVGVAATPDGRWVLVADSNRFSRSGHGALDAIPTFAFASAHQPPRRTLPTGAFPRELRFSPNGKLLAVTNAFSGTVEFINLAKALPH